MALLNCLLISKAIYKENCFSVYCEQCSIRYLIQATESVMFTNLKIGICCAVQERSWHVFDKLLE